MEYTRGMGDVKGEWGWPEREVGRGVRQDSLQGKEVCHSLILQILQLYAISSYRKWSFFCLLVLFCESIFFS